MGFALAVAVVGWGPPEPDPITVRVVAIADQYARRDDDWALTFGQDLAAVSAAFTEQCGVELPLVGSLEWHRPAVAMPQALGAIPYMWAVSERPAADLYILVTCGLEEVARLPTSPFDWGKPWTRVEAGTFPLVPCVVFYDHPQPAARRRWLAAEIATALGGFAVAEPGSVLSRGDPTSTTLQMDRSNRRAVRALAPLLGDADSLAASPRATAVAALFQLGGAAPATVDPVSRYLAKRWGDTGDVSFLRAAVAQAPGNLQAASCLINEESEDAPPERTLALLDEARARTEHPRSEDLGAWRYARALVSARAGDTQGAIRELRECVSAEPKHLTGLSDLTRLLLGSGDAAGCRALFQERLRARPNDVSAAMVYAAGLEKTGDSSGAVEVLSSVLALYPDYGPAYVARGFTRAARGLRSEAVADCRNALRLYPLDVQAGAILVVLAKPPSPVSREEAIELAQRYLAADPTGGLAGMVRQCLRILRGEAPIEDWPSLDAGSPIGDHIAGRTSVRRRTAA
jgi:tetratricopeptide (TPR) repeat protein